MDWRAVWWGISRDVEVALEAGPVGWAILLMIVALPLGSVLAVWKGSRLSLVPLAASAGLGALWILYYGTDWWSNPGLAGAAFAVLLVAVAWVPLLVALWRLRHRNQTPQR
ncbi:MAG: hypothetical protein R3343_05520 [Nitriliruptorales bacterium]|nr:hypothetical protein [Nitriliruptorales bacterium]